MRLSSRLSDKSQNYGEIESFINWEKYTIVPEERTDEIKLISDGDFIEIQIGKIILPFYSIICKDNVSFISPPKLHCLIINNQTISIDCQLLCMDYDAYIPKCQECKHCVQAWFLVGTDDDNDIFSSRPNINEIKQNFKLPEHIKLPIETEDKYSEWLGKAEIAYKERLGAGSIIYLRTVLEQITIEVGRNAGVAIYKQNGGIKPFEQVIKAVDEQCYIIPEIYRNNGYDLFRRLSNIAHGNSDEETALKEYNALRRLVVGIIENIKKNEEDIKNNNEIRMALNAIGFSNEGVQDDQT